MLLTVVNECAGVGVWDVINNILAVIGLISLLVSVFRTVWMFGQTSEWIENIEIEEFPLEKDFDDEKGYYPQFFPGHPKELFDEHLSQNLFMPKNSIIRNAVIKELRYVPQKGKPHDTVKYVTVKKIKEITPHSPLCLVIMRGEIYPTYKIEWRSEYGLKGEYYFDSNLRNGDNSLVGIKYRADFWTWIRRVLDLR